MNKYHLYIQKSYSHHEYYVYIFINIPISLQLGPVRPGGQMHRPVVVLQTPNLHSGSHSVIERQEKQ